MARKATTATASTGGARAAPYSNEPRPGLARLHEVVYEFVAAERRLMWRYKKAGDALSPGRLRALVVLMREGEATHGQLTRQAELNPATVTQMLEQLESLGLVSRRPHETDGRVWLVSLTANGRREVAELQAVWDRYFAQAFADTPEDELDTACDVLERVAQMFDSIGADGTV